MGTSLKVPLGVPPPEKRAVGQVQTKSKPKASPEKSVGRRCDEILPESDYRSQSGGHAAIGFVKQGFVKQGVVHETGRDVRTPAGRDGNSARHIPARIFAGRFFCVQPLVLMVMHMQGSAA
jgi:hypothetical protein